VVKVRFFSIFRELAGVEEESVEGVRTLGELKKALLEKYPWLGEWAERGEAVFLVDGKREHGDVKLNEESEVAVIPPVAGGGEQAFVDRVEPAELLRSVLELAGEKDGAVALFVGRVKGVIPAGRVKSLYYEVYEPHGTRTLKEIAGDAVKKWKVSSVYIYHKKGEAIPGEPVLFIAVVSPGRREAISALKEVLERVKHEPPVWKLEKLENGEYWILGGKRVPRGSP